MHWIDLHSKSCPSNKPIACVKILGRNVLLMRPSLDHELARHAKDMSLGSFASTSLCKALFGLSDEGVAALKQIDTRPSWHAEFVEQEAGRAVMDSALRYVETFFRDVNNIEVDFGAWLFAASAGATAHSLWGAESPWLGDDGVMEDF